MKQRQSIKCRKSMNRQVFSYKSIGVRTKALLAILGLNSLIFTSSVSAQTDDFGMDFSLEAGKKICKGVDFSIEGNARTQDNTKKIERWGTGASLGVKVYNTKTFDVKASVKWEYMWINNLAETKDRGIESKPVGFTPDGYVYTDVYRGFNYTDHYWRNRHRASAGLSATYSPNKRWTFSLKEMFQYNHFCNSSKTTYKYRYTDEEDPTSEMFLKEMETKDVKGKDRTVLRSKLSVQYDIRRCPIDPYVSGEYGCGLNYVAKKWKFEAGADYKLNKKNKLNLFYRYLTEDDDDEPNGHLVGIGYSIKL